MLSILAQVTLFCALVAAQCEPSGPGPSSSSSSNNPGPTGGAAVQFHPAKANNKCIDIESANFANGAKVQM